MLLHHFLTKLIGATHGDTLGHISPKYNKYFNYIFNSCNSGVDIRYGFLEIGSVPVFKSIVNSNSLFGGTPNNS
jgi:hypothetical protein